MTECSCVQANSTEASMPGDEAESGRITEGGEEGNWGSTL